MLKFPFYDAQDGTNSNNTNNTWKSIHFENPSDLQRASEVEQEEENRGQSNNQS